MENLNKAIEMQAKHVIEAMQKRKMDAYFFQTKEEALTKILELIPENSVVSFGGSMTLVQTGILDAIRKGNYTLLDRDKASSQDEIMSVLLESFSADYYLLSSNAITLDGKLINIDGRGNRIAALAFGPKNIIVVASMNKVMPDEESAIKRARSIAGPANSIRLSKKTPCTKTGLCHDCNSEECICNNIMITRDGWKKGRIKVILVGEPLGY